MSSPVTVTLSFPIYQGEDFAELAQEHWTLLEAQVGATGDGPTKEPRQMLLYAAEGHGVCCGSQGEMFTWGIRGNYTNLEVFIDDLKPFFVDLYNFGVISTGDGIVVMGQRDQDQSVYCAQIRSPWWESGMARPPYTQDQLLVEDKNDTTGPLWGWYR